MRLKANCPAPQIGMVCGARPYDSPGTAVALPVGEPDENARKSRRCLDDGLHNLGKWRQWEHVKLVVHQPHIVSIVGRSTLVDS